MMNEEITGTFSMTSLFCCAIGVASGAIIQDYQSFWITIAVFTAMLILLFITIQTGLNLIKTALGDKLMLVKKRDKNKLEYISHTYSGRKRKKYYFINETNVSQALEVARTFKKPVPQCWEKWTVLCPVRKGEQRHIVSSTYTAPSDGLILIFTHESPN